MLFAAELKMRVREKGLMEYICREGAIVVGCDEVCLLLLPLRDFLMRFLRFASKFSSQISLRDCMLFAAQFVYEIS
jgi:hypothetical protein